MRAMKKKIWNNRNVKERKRMEERKREGERAIDVNHGNKRL